MIDVSKKLKSLRAERGLTQKEVAKGININERTYRSYELGEFEPTLSNAKKLSEFFNVTIEYLIQQD